MLAQKLEHLPNEGMSKSSTDILYFFDNTLYYIFIHP